jgi:pyridoxal/pyridoxine/pyridoxamine kinase
MAGADSLQAYNSHTCAFDFHHEIKALSKLDMLFVVISTTQSENLSGRSFCATGSRQAAAGQLSASLRVELPAGNGAGDAACAFGGEMGWL